MGIKRLTLRLVGNALDEEPASVCVVQISSLSSDFLNGSVDASCEDGDGYNRLSDSSSGSHSRR